MSRLRSSSRACLSVCLYRCLPVYLSIYLYLRRGAGEMRGVSCLLPSFHLISSHLISSLPPPCPTHLSHPIPSLLERLQTPPFIYASTHPHALTSKRRSPTHRAGRAQRVPKRRCGEAVSARNEGAHAQKERLDAPESSGRRTFLARRVES
jgi:hypothetical protein